VNIEPAPLPTTSADAPDSAANDDDDDPAPAITLDLPWPVSTNSLYEIAPIVRKGKTVNGRFIKGTTKAGLRLTAEGRRFKEDVAWFAYRAGVRSPLPGRVRVRVTIYPQQPKDWQVRQRKYGDRWEDDVRCLDVDNALKATLDGLKGVCFGDDRFVWDVQSRRAPPRAVSGLRVEIWSVPYVEPQLDLFHEDKP
jgi:crossover junction endodeoxyribonuclease RusA